MDLLTLLGVVALAGGVGGAINGLHNNFLRSDLNTSDPVLKQLAETLSSEAEQIFKQAIETPKLEKWTSLFFNVVAGALASAISWSAYGPYSLENIVGGKPSDYGLTLTALATALVIGFVGTRWLTNERDKVLLKQAAENAAVESSGTDAGTTRELAATRDLMAIADPKQAERISRAANSAFRMLPPSTKASPAAALAESHEAERTK
jgi:hypothetical protein